MVAGWDLTGREGVVIEAAPMDEGGCVRWTPDDGRGNWTSAWNQLEPAQAKCEWEYVASWGAPGGHA